MGIYDNVETSVDFPKLEEEILRFWKEHKIFSKVRSLRKGGRRFVFLEGPPTANGLPHVGHVLTRCVKDVVLRFRTMIGDDVVPRIAGWDCHGLPVEIEVEKELRLNSKRDIEVFGVERFNEMCRMSVFKYEREWVKMTERTGTWLDMEHPYVTLSKEYIES
ncbi:MAG: class I tRNA ligase family protein, partial [Candidatus Jordarchaeales archaeon]